LFLLRPLVDSIMGKQIAMRIDQFDVLPLPADRVLFLGDSITQAGNWDEFFPEYATLERGIAGDTVAGVHDRLKSAINKPAAISLLIGTNDLARGGKNAKPPAIIARIEQLVAAIRQLAPDVPLVINSVMPRSARYAKRIHVLNEGIATIAKDAGATFVDTWPALVDDAGTAIRSEFSLDALHLNGVGYQAWVDALRPHLAAAIA
jgi:lysophospholipase L1-like esterase